MIGKHPLTLEFISWMDKVVGKKKSLWPDKRERGHWEVKMWDQSMYPALWAATPAWARCDREWVTEEMP